MWWPVIIGWWEMILMRCRCPCVRIRRLKIRAKVQDRKWRYPAAAQFTQLAPASFCLKIITSYKKGPRGYILSKVLFRKKRSWCVCAQPNTAHSTTHNVGVCDCAPMMRTSINLNETVPLFSSFLWENLIPVGRSVGARLLPPPFFLPNDLIILNFTLGKFPISDPV